MIARKIRRLAEGSFTSPEKLPSHAEEAKTWQEANKFFWENNSMRYDWDKQVGYEEFSEPFYEEIDRRFFGAIKEVMPWRKIPFEQWLSFEDLRNKEVLEIGVGNGSHCQLIAPWTKAYTGIDLTDYAVKSTSRRIALKGIVADIRQMDAEKLQFSDGVFDLVWSWGVIHHSSNTDGILNEIQRVLRPGGKAVIMVYYRSWYSYYLFGLLSGLFQGHFFKGRSIHHIIQLRTDGALARYYSFGSWRRFVSNRFKIDRMETIGNKADILPIPAGKIKGLLLKMIPTWMAIIFLKSFKMGTFLVCEMTRK